MWIFFNCKLFLKICFFNIFVFVMNVVFLVYVYDFVFIKKNCEKKNGFRCLYYLCVENIDIFLGFVF